MRLLPVLLGSLLGSPLALAAGDPCAALPAPSVSVKLLEAPVTLNRDYDIKLLNSMAGDATANKQLVLGLTRGQAVVRYETQIRLLVERSGQWECASPQITLSYGFSPLTVYVAREFPLGSCAYDEILDHEQRHVRAYREHARAIELEIVDTLRQRFVTGSPWRGPVGQAQQRLREELSERWTPYIKRLLNRAEEAQAKIDTPEEYERVSHSCGGEVRKRLRR